MIISRNFISRYFRNSIKRHCGRVEIRNNDRNINGLLRKTMRFQYVCFDHFLTWYLYSYKISSLDTCLPAVRLGFFPPRSRSSSILRPGSSMCLPPAHRCPRHIERVKRILCLVLIKGDLRLFFILLFSALL